MADTALKKKKRPRIASIDAFRGFVMLAMAANGFAFAGVLSNHPDVLYRYESTIFATAWEVGCRWLVHQFSHIPWGGCTFWDLIQPSFLFIVGVAMPFSYAKRHDHGQSAIRRLGHVLFRSLVLIVLGVFLQSKNSDFTNFSFVNVLTQIGLGYAFVYLLLGRHYLLQLLAIVGILGGYWYYFYQYEMPASDRENLTQYLDDDRNVKDDEWKHYSGTAAHWNKHTNAAAAFDRDLLNRFPQAGTEWNGKNFWINAGGYQTLNFIPSMATILLGLMAGQWLLGDREDALPRFIVAGFICFLVAMAVDTSILPVQFESLSWNLCPIVKRIWTPSWTLFSSGWCFWMLAGFYWLIDVKGYKRLAFPLVVVGMNSIAMYLMAQLMQGWVSKMLQTHLTTVDRVFGSQTVFYLFSSEYTFAPIFDQLARLAVLWLICLWLYRRRIFVRI